MNRKIYCRTEEESIAVQEKAFRLGYKWNGSLKKKVYYTNSKFLFFNEPYKNIAQEEEDAMFFLEQPEVYTEVADFLALPEPKREFDLKPFDRVLVRDNTEQEWRIDLYSNITCSDIRHEDRYMCLCSYWQQIALYEGNEKYLGTSDDIQGSWTAEDLK